jgi:hypothetical protein
MKILILRKSLATAGEILLPVGVIGWRIVDRIKFARDLPTAPYSSERIVLDR